MFRSGGEWWRRPIVLGGVAVAAVAGIAAAVVLLGDSDEPTAEQASVPAQGPATAPEIAPPPASGNGGPDSTTKRGGGSNDANVDGAARDGAEGGRSSRAARLARCEAELPRETCVALLAPLSPGSQEVDQKGGCPPNLTRKQCAPFLAAGKNPDESVEIDEETVKQLKKRQCPPELGEEMCAALAEAYGDG